MASYTIETMMNPKLNLLQDFRQSYLVPGRSATGQPILQLDRDCDGQVSAKDPALVIRDSVDSPWRPVQSPEEVQTYLASSPLDTRGLNLGVWQDRKRWIFFSPDGQMQPKEVANIGGPPKSEQTWTLRGGTSRPPQAEQLWNTERFHHTETKDHYEYNVPEFTGYFYTKIDPARVSVTEVDTPNGPQAVLNEGQVISRARIEQVTCFARDGQNWVPMGFKDIDYRGVLD